MMLLKPFLLAMMIGFSSITAPAAKEVVDTVTLERATMLDTQIVTIQDEEQIVQIREYLEQPRETVRFNSPPTGGSLSVTLRMEGVETTYTLKNPDIIRKEPAERLTWERCPEEFYLYLDSFFPAE